MVEDVGIVKVLMNEGCVEKLVFVLFVLYYYILRFEYVQLLLIILK